MCSNNNIVSAQKHKLWAIRHCTQLSAATSYTAVWQQWEWKEAVQQVVL